MIKFRVWSKIEKKVKYYDRDCSSPNMTLNGVLIDDLNSNVSYQYELMQHTNIKDIWESDVAALDFETIHLKGIVQQTDSGEWELYQDEGNHVGILHNLDRIKIIGNIHENPELLEKE